MIRITTHQSLSATQLLLEGKLSGDSVPELEKCWQRAMEKRASVHVDLSAVSFVDGRGKQLLTKMFKKGTLLVSKGLMAKCLIEEIERESE